MQSYIHHETYGQARSLPDAVRIVRRHLVTARVLSGAASKAAEAIELAGPAPPATAERAHDGDAHGPGP